MKKIIFFKTKFGWISCVEKKQKITSILFKKLKNKNFSKKLIELKKNLLEHLKSGKKIYNNSIKIEGTKLQIKIWKELKKIPYGKTKSYGDIAKIVNTSPRYVGNVCGQNNYLLYIPCHRVIRSDGNLGGFSATGGVNIKRKLINLENSKL